MSYPESAVVEMLIEKDIPTTFTLHVDDVLPAEFESSHIHDPVSDNLDSLTDKRQTTAVGPRSFMAELVYTGDEGLKEIIERKISDSYIRRLFEKY